MLDAGLTSHAWIHSDSDNYYRIEKISLMFFFIVGQLNLILKKNITETAIVVKVSLTVASELKMLDFAIWFVGNRKLKKAVTFFIFYVILNYWNLHQFQFFFVCFFFSLFRNSKDCYEIKNKILP